MTKSEIQQRKEELKYQHSATEVLASYGIVVRHNRCVPFCHKCGADHMKVFADGCFCFVCNRTFDIFDITMHFNHCDFWTAFQLLGGTDKPSFTATVQANRARIERERRVVEELAERERMGQIYRLVTLYRMGVEQFEVLSDEWCECVNRLQYQVYLMEVN